MPRTRELLPIFAASILLSSLFPAAPDVEARTRRSAGRATAASRSRGRLASARRRHKNADQAPAPTSYVVVPDKIEVYEYNASGSQNTARYLKLTQPAAPGTAPGTFSVARRNNLVMDSTRVVEIQQALTSRGFFNEEATGIYDDATIDAMQRFQRSQKIPVTGYPTAHALRRLGLAN